MPPRPLALLSLLLVLFWLPGQQALATDDPYFGQQWHLDRIDAPGAWATTGGGGAVVAVIDSGVDLDHPDLRARLLRDGRGRVVGRDYVDEGSEPQDEHGHGTLVAGVVAAVAGNGLGVAGVAPGARIMPVRILDGDGNGSGEDLDAAIRWAVDHGADVVNLSLEATTGIAGARIGVGASAPAAAVRYAWDNDVAVVAAAGNSGTAVTDYPPTSPVLLVGATDRDDERAAFSDQGRRDAVVAPGVEIVSTWCRARSGGCDGTGDGDGVYGQASGTSFAAPQVAGVVGLLRAQGHSAAASVERVRATARDLGPRGQDLTYGHGLVDAAAAVGAGSEPGDDPDDPRPAEVAPARPASPTPRAQPAPTPAPPTGSASATSPPSPSPVDAGPTPAPVASGPASPPVEAAAPGQAPVRPGWLHLAAGVLVLMTGALHLAAAAEQRARGR